MCSACVPASQRTLSLRIQLSKAQNRRNASWVKAYVDALVHDLKVTRIDIRT